MYFTTHHHILNSTHMETASKVSIFTEIKFNLKISELVNFMSIFRISIKNTKPIFGPVVLEIACHLKKIKHINHLLSTKIGN